MGHRPGPGPPPGSLCAYLSRRVVGAYGPSAAPSAESSSSLRSLSLFAFRFLTRVDPSLTVVERRAAELRFYRMACRPLRRRLPLGSAAPGPFPAKTHARAFPTRPRARVPGAHVIPSPSPRAPAAPRNRSGSGTRGLLAAKTHAGRKVAACSAHSWAGELHRRARARAHLQPRADVRGVADGDGVADDDDARQGGGRRRQRARGADLRRAVRHEAGGRVLRGGKTRGAAIMLGPQLLERRQPQAGGASHTHRGASVYVKVCQGDLSDHVHVCARVCVRVPAAAWPHGDWAPSVRARGAWRAPRCRA